MWLVSDEEHTLGRKDMYGVNYYSLSDLRYRKFGPTTGNGLIVSLNSANYFIGLDAKNSFDFVSLS